MRRFTKSELGLYALPLASIALGAWYFSLPDPPSAPSANANGSTISASANREAAGSLASHAAFATPRLQVDPERPALQPLPPPPSIAAIRSPIADRLLAPANTGAQDLTIVQRLLDHYREAFGSFPTADDNATIVNALTGNNPRRLAFIDRTHPAINTRGELVDRWQTPIFFHMESRDAIELRSAGPDREMYSGDDVTHASAGLRAVAR